MIKTCRECGKEFDVLYPDLWRYRRGNWHRQIYLCSWSCLRLFDERKETEMPKKGRDRIALAEKLVEEISQGRDPMAYLREVGYKNEAQAYHDIRVYVREKRPDLFARFPENLRAWKYEKGLLKGAEVPEKVPAPIGGGKWEKMETPESVPAVKVDGPLRIETPEANRIEVVQKEDIQKAVNNAIEKAKIYRPVRYDDFTVRCVEGKYGCYAYAETCMGKFINFEHKDLDDTISMTIEEWREFFDEIKKAAKVLGVEL